MNIESSYKEILITVERIIPQLIEKIRYIEQTKVLSTYNFRLIPLRRNLYNMIQFDFVKYMFLLE